MPIVGFRINGHDLSFAAALTAASRGETEYGYPVLAAIVAQITHKDRPPPSAGLSASQFGGCLRKVALEPLVDYYDDPRSQYWLVRGTWTHATIEDAMRAIPEAHRVCYTQEVRLFASLPMTIGDKEMSLGVHGRYDLLYTPPDVGSVWDHPELANLGQVPILYDHKTTRMIPTKGAKSEHVWQCSIYTWLMAQNLYPQVPTQARINYLDPSDVIQYVVPLATQGETEDYMRAKARPYLEARMRGALPPRVGEAGRWQCGQNRTQTSYCPFTARCWPAGIGENEDGLEGFKVAEGAQE